MSHLDMRDIYGLDQDGTKTIVVKHFPPTIDELRFQSYLKNIFGVENCKLVLPYVGCSVAVASLDVEEDISDFIGCYQENVFLNPIKSCYPELKMLGSPTGVFLENVPDCVDQSVITTHFENLGTVDNIKRTCVGNRLCFAISIPDVCVVHSLLSKDAHCISGQTLSLQPYYPPVHDDIVDYMQNEENGKSDSEAFGFHNSEESIEEVHPKSHSNTQILSAYAIPVRPVSPNCHDSGTVYDDNSDDAVTINPLAMPVNPGFVQSETVISKYKSGGGGITIVQAQSPRNVATVTPLWVRRTSPDDHSLSDDEYRNETIEQYKQSSSEVDTDDELNNFCAGSDLKSKDKMEDASGFVKTVPDSGAVRGNGRKQRLSNDWNGGMDETTALQYMLSLSMQDREQYKQSSSEADTDDELKDFCAGSDLKSKDKMEDASGFVKSVPDAGAVRGYKRKQRLSNDRNGGMDEATALKHTLSHSMQDRTMPVQLSNYSRSKHQSQSNKAFGKRHVPQRLGSNIRSEKVDGVSVQIMKAEIAKHKADVLVNVINAAGQEPFNTAVAKSFLNVGGTDLQQMFQTISMRPVTMSLVTATQATGDLQCKSVFHVKITKDSDCKQVVDTTMVEILNNCAMSGIGTVAIPPLGIGRMFQFPAKLVAKRMLKQVYKYIDGAQRNHLLKVVTIVIYDDDTYHTFDDALSDIARKYLNQHQQGRQTRDRFIDDAFSDNARKYINQPQQGRQPVQVNQSRRGHLKERAPLQRTRPSRYYHPNRRSQDDDNDRKATPEVQKTMELLKNPKMGTNVRKGHSEKVKRTKADMRLPTDTIEKLLLEDVEAPKYWNNYQQGTSIPKMFLGAFNHLIGHKHEKIQLNATTPEYKEIIRMINKTFDAQKVGLGADASGIQQGSYRKLHVLKVKRVENLELYEKFALKRKACFRRLHQSGRQTYPIVKDLPSCQRAPDTSCYGEGALGRDMHSEINEYLFFHGTKSDAIDVVCNNGFDQKLGTRDAMLGQGIYGAERSTKADQYTDPTDKRSYGQGNKKEMFLIRMILGNPYVSSEQNPHKFKRPPCTVCYKDDCKNTEHAKGKFGHFFDSVIGENRKLFREFVVYEGDLCYPEYLITYERL